MARGPVPHTLPHVFLSQFMLSPEKRVCGVGVAVISPTLPSMWNWTCYIPFFGRREGEGATGARRTWQPSSSAAWTACFSLRLVEVLAFVISASCRFTSVSSLTLDICPFPSLKHVCWLSSSSSCPLPFTEGTLCLNRHVFYLGSKDRNRWVGIDQWVGGWIDG